MFGLNHWKGRGRERRGCGGVCGDGGDGDDAHCRNDANANGNVNGQHALHAPHAPHAPLVRVWPLGAAASFAPLYNEHFQNNTTCCSNAALGEV